MSCECDAQMRSDGRASDRNKSRVLTGAHVSVTSLTVCAQSHKNNATSECFADWPNRICCVAHEKQKRCNTPETLATAQQCNAGRCVQRTSYVQAM
jgi:hypothetical protein